MVNIAVLGYGVVGSGLVEVWDMNRDEIFRRTGLHLNIKKILDIRDFPDSPFHALFTRRAEDVFSDPEISVVVETIGGSSISYDYTKQALLAGKSVVTSNKELVASHGPELLRIARDKKVSYLFEASVGGGIPIIRPMNKCLAANKIQAITGILNGTTNFILTKMFEENMDFEHALSIAQNLGYAEQNPISDVEGTDASRKLAILASIATGNYIDYRSIFTQGISNLSPNDFKYAKNLGYSIKLIGRISGLDRERPEAIVAPMMVSQNSPLYGVTDVYNAIMVDGNALGRSMYYGHGAGKLPTASAVMADVIEASLHINLKPHPILMDDSMEHELADHSKTKTSALVTLTKSSESDDLINRLNHICDVSEIPGSGSGQRALIVGRSKPITEGDLTDLVVKNKDTLSVIRILAED